MHLLVELTLWGSYGIWLGTTSSSWRPHRCANLRTPHHVFLSVSKSYILLSRCNLVALMHTPQQLIFSLLSVAFQIPFNRNFGKGGFVIFWMLAWVGMTALSVEYILLCHTRWLGIVFWSGLAIEALITLITPRFAPYFMILWLIRLLYFCGIL